VLAFQRKSNVPVTFAGSRLRLADAAAATPADLTRTARSGVTRPTKSRQAGGFITDRDLRELSKCRPAGGEHQV